MFKLKLNYPTDSLNWFKYNVNYYKYIRSLLLINWGILNITWTVCNINWSVLNIKWDISNISWAVLYQSWVILIWSWKGLVITSCSLRFDGSPAATPNKQASERLKAFSNCSIILISKVNRYTFTPEGGGGWLCLVLKEGMFWVRKKLFLRLNTK